MEPSIHSSGADNPGRVHALPRPGERVGHYELIRELGRGGMGVVFLARDTKLGRRVAIKFLRSDKPEVTARFLIEAQATAQCNHEHIVVIYEVGEHDGQPFMVLEYLEGSPLSRLIEQEQALAPSRAVGLIVPVVRALARAHEHGIVHRDLKPDNIFVTDTGVVKVVDFGIAKLVEEHQPTLQFQSSQPSGVTVMDLTALNSSHAHALTRQGALVGTLPYMSPEQWGADTVDHRTDLWAIGIILFEMVSGRRPLDGKTGWEIAVTGMLHEPMPDVRQACPGLPEHVAAIIDRCLVKPKAERVGSARELLAMLEPLLPMRLSRALTGDESPYAGLRAFQESDAGRFFGRSREIAEAVARLRGQPLIGVVGPSGVGKSSFVRAGVVPGLKHSGEPWEAIVLRPGRRPLVSLAHVIAPMLSQDTAGASASLSASLSDHDAVLTRLYHEPGYFGTVLRSRARARGHKILLFIDQFEELYTLVDDAGERLAFTASLASVADDATTPLRVMLSVRSDFLDRVAEDPRFLAELTRGLLFLSAPGRDSLRSALTQPAELAGYRFEHAGIVDHMLDHLAQTSGALPLLQFAAARLWDLRDQTRRLLTDHSYRAIGGIAGALASHADAVLAELPAPTQALARAVFLRLVTPERTRAVVSLDELDELSHRTGEVRALVDQLARARLLVVQSGDQGAAGQASVSVEIVHESLVHSWPVLRRWLDENQDDAALLDQLRTAARQWQAKGYPSGLLWRGEAVDEARRWHRRYRGPLPELQRAYLHAAFSLADRAARRTRMAIAGTIGFLALLVVAAAVALLWIRDAEQQASDQAQAARRAEATVRAQLDRIQAAERARQKAAADKLAAEESAQAARLDLDRINQKLKAANDELSAALERVNAVKQLQRSAAEQAEKSDEAARRERERAKQLEEEQTGIVRDIRID